jgi:prepilin-type N-terminal cleavage/methylation domain-containing protein
MKRAGFTMIELIFVIVILGILAAVAIPKLAATRDDAKIAKDASDASTALSDMGAYYTAHGAFSTVGKMTNVKFSSSKTAFVDASTTDMNGTNTIYMMDSTGKDPCLSFKATAVDGNLTLTSESNSTAECKGLNKAIKKLETTHQFGGSSVEY